MAGAGTVCAVAVVGRGRGTGVATTAALFTTGVALVAVAGEAEFVTIVRVPGVGNAGGAKLFVLPRSAARARAATVFVSALFCADTSHASKATTRRRIGFILTYWGDCYRWSRGGVDP